MSTPSPVGLPPSSLPVAVGDTVAGKYRLDRVLGSSGMGIVYGATHLGIDSRVAVKFLLPKVGQDRDAMVRFQREAKFTAKINSDHVVRVADVGSLPSGSPFIVMEYLDGEDLSRVARRERPMPIERALEFVLQACEGLADAHAAGVIHRDLKPSNLFLTRTPDGREIVKIIDFGIAKYRGNDDTNPQPESDSLTQTQVMIGSPRYMAPEQVRASKDVDSRADVWSLAIILQELLTGRAVFKGPTSSDSLVMILTLPPERADKLRPDVPSGLADAIERALAKEVNARTPSVVAFAQELLPYTTPTRRMALESVFARGLIPAPPRSFSSADASGPISAIPSPEQMQVISAVTRKFSTEELITPPPSQRIVAEKKSRGKIAIVIGVAAVTLLVASSVFFFARRDRQVIATNAPPTPIANTAIAQPTALPPPTENNPVAPPMTSAAIPAATTTATKVSQSPKQTALPHIATQKPKVSTAQPAPTAAPTTKADLFDDPK